MLETAQQVSLSGSDIGICRSADAYHCQDKGDHWLLFFDVSNDGSIEDKKQIIHQYDLYVKQGRIILRSYPFYRQYLRFAGNTTIDGDNATISYYRLNDLSPKWQLVINKAGRIREVTSNHLPAHAQ